MPAGDGVIELLHAAEAFREGSERPSGSGIPILFPFPGRLRGESFRYDGRDYVLEAGDGRGNAIHGFVYNRPWRVLEHEGNTLRAQFTASVDDPAILERWPGDFQITATYTIEDTQLRLALIVENPGETPCPWGLGLHPYLRTPIQVVGAQEAGNTAECLLQVPVSRAWELVDMLPTGKQTLASEIEGTGGGDLREGITLADHHLDDVFNGVGFVDGEAVGRVIDQVSGRAIEVTWDETFSECLLYTPGHREAVCIEPYTCVPDAYALGQQGVETGQRVLEPRDRCEMRMTIALAKTGSTEGADDETPG